MSNTSADQMTAKDLAIGIHVLMKANPDWQRFSGHQLSKDRHSLTIPTEDGRTFTVAVYESDLGRPYNADILTALMQLLPETSTMAEIHAALVSYVNMWRDTMHDGKGS